MPNEILASPPSAHTVRVPQMLHAMLSRGSSLGSLTGGLSLHWLSSCLRTDFESKLALWNAASSTLWAIRTPS